MAGYVAAYRIGMLASGAGVIALAAWFAHIGVARRCRVDVGLYCCGCALMAVGLLASLMATEPPRADATDKVARSGQPRRTRPPLAPSRNS